MTWRHLALSAALLAALTTPVLTQNLGADLQRAQQRVATTGDCKAVLAEYARIVEQGSKSNRAVAAEALLQTGMCHEREGRSQDAKSTYARVTLEFADVPSMAAQASARANAIPEGRGAAANREVPPFTPAALDFLRPLGPGRGYSMSPDGRVIAYDASTRGLGLHSLAGGPDRFFTGVAPRAFHSLGLVWSPDSTRFAVHSLASGSSPNSVSVVTVATGKVALLDSWPGDSQAGTGMSWSSDGQFVAFSRSHRRGGDRPCPGGAANITECVWEIRVVSASGAAPPEVIAESDAIPTFVWSPTGHDLAHTLARKSDIFIVTPGQKDARTVATPRVRALIAWTRDNSLWSREASNGSLSDHRLALSTGELGPATAPGDRWIGVTPDGSSVLVYKPDVGRLAIRRASDGDERPLTTGAGKEMQAMLSQDGRLAFFASNRDGKWAFYVAPIDRAPLTNPVLLAQLDGMPTDSDTTAYGHWSAGVIITATPYRESHIVRVGLDQVNRRSTGPPERLTVSWAEAFMSEPAPGGKVVAFNTTGNTRPAIAVIEPAANREAIVLEHDRVKLRWRSAEELLYSEAMPQWGIGPAFHTLNVVTGVKSRPAFPDLPVEPSRNRLLDWDYLPATDEILFVTGVAMPNPNAIPRTGPYTFRVHSLRDGRSRVVSTRDQFDYPNGTVSVSADGRFAAFVAKGSVQVLDLQNPAQDRTLPPGMGRLVSLSWSPDNRHLLGCNLAARCFVIAADSGQNWPLVEISPADQAARWSDARWSADGGSAYVTRAGIRFGWLTFEGVTYDAVTKLMSSRRGGR